MRKRFVRRKEREGKKCRTRHRPSDDASKSAQVAILTDSRDVFGRSREDFCHTEEASTTRKAIGTRDDFDEKPLKKRGGILQSNKNGLRRGAARGKATEERKIRGNEAGFMPVRGGWESLPVRIDVVRLPTWSSRTSVRSRAGFPFLAGRCFFAGKCPYEKKMKDVKRPFGIRCSFYERHENDRSSSKETKTLRSRRWPSRPNSFQYHGGPVCSARARIDVSFAKRATKYLEKDGVMPRACLKRRRGRSRL